MLEVSEEPKTQSFDLQKYVDVARRRHIYFLIPLLLGWLAVWSLGWILPSTYKSSTLILVEPPSVPTDYVKPNVGGDFQDRMQSITQQILSRTRLLLIIDQLDLYNDSRKRMTPDEKVNRMRKDIDIALVRDSQDNQITAFTISYVSRNPHTAQLVTGELSNLFIDANLEVRQKESEGTTNFLESQLDQARVSLGDQEEKIREFKGEHIGELPSQQPANLQILSGLQLQLGNEQEALGTAQQQRVYLQSLISQYHTLQGTGKSPDGTPARLPAIDQELDKLRAQLADLSSHYTDQYPDIRNLKVQIARMEKVRSDLIVELRNRANASSQAGANAHELVDPTQNPALLQLQGQLHANQIEIANRERTITDLKNKIGDYQGRLNQEPIREQQMADLTRGYDQSKANYDDLLKKKNESQMATSMEQLQQGERFKVLDPPSLPLKPNFPNRMKFCAMGVAVGIIFGLIVAGGLELMDDRLYSEKEIKNLLPTTVISEIPEISGAGVERNNKARMLMGWGLAGFIFVVILAGSAFNYLHS